jgi:hypothetical protein
MGDIYPPPKQREALLQLVAALGCRDACLRKDECGDPRIVGKLGHIYAVPGTLDRRTTPGFLICFRGAAEFEEPASSRAWTFAKQAMAFAEVTQDGDEEGVLFLDRLPSAGEAEIIRLKLGIAKKREMSEAELERLRSMGRPFEKRPAFVGGKTAAGTASDDPDGSGQRDGDEGG